MEDLRDLRELLNRVAKRVETDVKKLEGKVDKLMKLPDTIEIEHLMKTMAWAIDLDDKDLWLSIWSDDIHYTVPQYNINIKGKKALKEFGERTVFNTEKRKFSALTNIMIDVRGDTATGKDYFSHYGTLSILRLGRYLRSVPFPRVCTTINSAKTRGYGKSRSSKFIYTAERNLSRRNNKWARILNRTLNRYFPPGR